MTTIDDVRVIAEDAPTPDETESDSVTTMGRKLWDLVAVSHDGEVYCLECSTTEYQELAKSDPYAIPYGGPIDRGSEFDQAPSCGHCHRTIDDVSVIGERPA